MVVVVVEGFCKGPALVNLVAQAAPVMITLTISTRWSLTRALTVTPPLHLFPIDEEIDSIGFTWSLLVIGLGFLGLALLLTGSWFYTCSLRTANRSTTTFTTLQMAPYQSTNCLRQATKFAGERPNTDVHLRPRPH